MCDGCWDWLLLLFMINPDLLQISLWAEISSSIFMEYFLNVIQYSEF
jgi:hypothetical protein